MKETRKCEELLNKVNHYQVKSKIILFLFLFLTLWFKKYIVCEMKRQIESYKEAQEANIKTIRSLEANLSKLNSEKAETVSNFISKC